MKRLSPVEHARYDTRQTSLFGRGHEQELTKEMKMKKNNVATKTSGRKPVTSAKTAELLATKVVATNKAKKVRPTSFFGIMASAAVKPVEMGKLIAITAKKASLRSEQDVATVAHVRVRDAFTRLGLLKKAS